MDDAEQILARKDRPIVNPHFVLRQESGEDEGGLLYDVETGTVRILNAVAADVWKLLEKGYSPSRIMMELEGRYEDIDPEAPRQVSALLERLCEFGALAFADGSTG